LRPDTPASRVVTAPSRDIANSSRDAPSTQALVVMTSSATASAAPIRAAVSPWLTRSIAERIAPLSESAGTTSATISASPQ
jgi:hypothetical protein